MALDTNSEGESESDSHSDIFQNSSFKIEFWKYKERKSLAINKILNKVILYIKSKIWTPYKGAVFMFHGVSTPC